MEMIRRKESSRREKERGQGERKACRETEREAKMCHLIYISKY